MKTTRLFKWFVILGLTAVVIYSARHLNGGEEAYREQVAQLRQEKDQQFKLSPDSPLPVDQIAAFASLAYFDPKPEFRVQARYQKLPQPEPILFNLTGHKQEQYLRYAEASFSLSGKPCRLSLFKRPAHTGDERLFVPFTDASNGLTTYGGGRYLDVPEPAGQEVELDFNLAYNPYCAYSAEYSCPVPPRENHLAVPVEAGEMAFGK